LERNGQPIKPRKKETKAQKNWEKISFKGCAQEPVKRIPLMYYTGID